MQLVVNQALLRVYNRDMVVQCYRSYKCCHIALLHSIQGMHVSTQVAAVSVGLVIRSGTYDF